MKATRLAKRGEGADHRHAGPKDLLCKAELGMSCNRHCLPWWFWGSSMGAIAWHRPLRGVFLPFVLIVMVSLSGRFFWEGCDLYVTMGLMILVFAALLIFIGEGMHVIHVRSVKARFQKKGLIAELRKLKSKLQLEIKQRAQANGRAGESEKCYRLILEHVPDLIYMLDTEGRVTFVNPVVFQILGYSEDELIGMSYRELVAESDLERVVSFFAGQYTGEEEETRIDICLNGRSGETYWTSHNIRLITVGNRRVGIQGVCRDISGRKRAEELLREVHDRLEERVRERTKELLATTRYLEGEIAERRKIEEALRRSEQSFRAVFQRAEDCMFIKDRGLRYTHANPAMVMLVGIKESDIVGRRDDEVFGSAYAAKTENLETRVLAGETVQDEQSGNWADWPATFDFIRFPMYDQGGAVKGLCAIMRDVTSLRSQVSPVPRVDGNHGRFRSRAFAKTHELLMRAADYDSIILFLGESGSGKDHHARYLHDQSPRAGGPFFSVSCAAISPALFESELFGYEAGAFTGARKRKRGLLELAEGGTLLLNEIGEMPMELQAKLLAFLDERAFTRVGGEKAVSPNTRILAATNRDLAQDVEDGRFRKDLFYRLNVLSIEVPPLRERREDIPALAETMIHDLAGELGLGADFQRMDAGAMAALCAYDWPGNVRELRNVLERALILTKGGNIMARDLGINKKAMPLKVVTGPYRGNDADLPVETSLPEALKKTKQALIESALRKSNGNISKAADLLGITRDSLKHHIKAVGIEK